MLQPLNRPAPQPIDYFNGDAGRALRLFPESEYLQREWRRAVGVVRKTRKGWLLDQPIPKQEQRRA